MGATHLISMPLQKAFIFIWIPFVSWGGKSQAVPYHFWYGNVPFCECVGWWKQRYLCECVCGHAQANIWVQLVFNITFYDWRTWQIAVYWNSSGLVTSCNNKHKALWRQTSCLSCDFNLVPTSARLLSNTDSNITASPRQIKKSNTMILCSCHITNKNDVSLQTIMGLIYLIYS